MIPYVGLEDARHYYAASDIDIKNRYSSRQKSIDRGITSIMHGCIEA